MDNNTVLETIKRLKHLEKTNNEQIDIAIDNDNFLNIDGFLVFFIASFFGLVTATFIAFIEFILEEAVYYYLMLTLPRLCMDLKPVIWLKRWF
jgi:hypothetical protein